MYHYVSNYVSPAWWLARVFGLLTDRGSSLWRGGKNINHFHTTLDWAVMYSEYKQAAQIQPVPGMF